MSKENACSQELCNLMLTKLKSRLPIIPRLMCKKPNSHCQALTRVKDSMLMCWRQPTEGWRSSLAVDVGLQSALRWTRRKRSSTTKTLQVRNYVICGQFLIVLEELIDQVKHPHHNKIVPGFGE
jgi:hypothetical protein